MKTTNPDHPIKNTLKHFAAAVAVAGGLLAGTALAAPANNDFANAIDLPNLSGTQTGTNNIDATLEVGEPNPGDTRTVWFKWTAPASGDFTYGTLGSTNVETPLATEWDAVIGIYSGSALNALTPLGATPQDTNLQESMTVPVLKGTTYYIQLATYGPNTAANILLSWNFVPVNNDNFARAIALTGVAADQTGDIYAGTQTGTDNAGATLEVGEPIPGPTESNSVWFKWTAPSDGEFFYNTLGSTNVAAADWDAVIGIYSGAALNTLTPLGGTPKDTGGPENMTVDVYSGVTYFIQLTGWQNDPALNLLLSWNFVPDGLPEIVNSTPPDGSTTSPDSNLVLTFNKPIAFSSGNITIKDLTTPANDRVMSVDPSLDPQLSISGRVLTINPTTDLVEGNLYAVQIDDTAIIDTASQEFAGILDNTTLNFTAFAKTLTTTTVVSSGSPSIYGNNVTFTATVVPAPSGGTVQFKNNGSNLGAPASVNTSTGVAIVTTSALGVAGSNVITAVYSSNFQFEGSTSGSISQVVTKAGLTVTARNVGRYPLIANPTLPYLITGFMNAQTLGTSGVTGTAALSTTASSSSPIGEYPITPVVGTLAAANYDFTSFVDGTLTVVDPASPIKISLNIDKVVRPVLVGPAGGLGEIWNTIETPFGYGSSHPDLQTNYGGATPASGPVTTVGLTVPHTGEAAGGGLTVGVDPWGSPSLLMLQMGNFNQYTGDGNGQRFVITGLNPAKTYDLHIASANCSGQYSQGVWYTNNTTSSTSSPSSLPVSPVSMACGNVGNINGDSWVLGNNNVLFEDVVPDVLGKITIDGYSTGGYRLPLSGFQLVEVPAADDYAAWATTNGATTAELDHDNDGVENGVEYFMGETGSSFTAMPGLDATNTIIWPASGTYEGTYEVQTSPDLVTWTNVDPKPLPSGGNLSYTLPTGEVKLFLRLLVTPTP